VTTAQWMCSHRRRAHRSEPADRSRFALALPPRRGERGERCAMSFIVIAIPWLWIMERTGEEEHRRACPGLRIPALAKDRAGRIHWQSSRAPLFPRCPASRSECPFAFHGQDSTVGRCVCNPGVQARLVLLEAATTNSPSRDAFELRRLRPVAKVAVRSGS
jgi:hypothetical protein